MQNLYWTLTSLPASDIVSLKNCFLLNQACSEAH